MLGVYPQAPAHFHTQLLKTLSITGRYDAVPGCFSKRSAGCTESGRSRESRELLSTSTGKMRVVFFVFETVMLEQIGVGQELLDHADGDRTGEGAGIGHRDGEIEVAVI